MALTEEQLAEAQQELIRRQKERTDQYTREYAERQRVAEEAFWARMQAKYPQLDKDTMHDIWSEIDDWYR